MSAALVPVRKVAHDGALLVGPETADSRIFRMQRLDRGSRAIDGDPQIPQRSMNPVKSSLGSCSWTALVTSQSRSARSGEQSLGFEAAGQLRAGRRERAGAADRVMRPRWVPWPAPTSGAGTGSGSIGVSLQRPPAAFVLTPSRREPTVPRKAGPAAHGFDTSEGRRPDHADHRHALRHQDLPRRDQRSRADGLIAEIETACLSIAEDDEAGQRWCEKNGYPGYTSYASLNDLPWRVPVFGDLRKALDRTWRPSPRSWNSTSRAASSFSTASGSTSCRRAASTPPTSILIR